MSKTATLNLIATVSGDGQNNTVSSNAGSFPISLADSPGVADEIVLAAGFNSVTAKKSVAGTVASYLLLWPSSSVNVKTLKGVTGDTGVTFTGQAVLIPIASGVTVVGITATAGETVQGMWL